MGIEFDSFAIQEPKTFTSQPLHLVYDLPFYKHVNDLFFHSKLHRYSPTEVNRANDKQCHRKRPDLRFEPQPALAHIDRLRRKVHCRDPEYVNAVVKQYTQVIKKTKFLCREGFRCAVHCTRDSENS